MVAQNLYQRGGDVAGPFGAMRYSGVHLAILLVMAIAMTGPLACPRHCAPTTLVRGALASAPSHRRRFRYRCR